MIEIKVNDEVRDVQTDFFMGLSLSQLLYCILGLIFSCALGFLLYLKLHVPLFLITYLVIPVVLPFAAMAFFSWHEMSAADCIRLYITRHFIDPVIKTYGSTNQVLQSYLRKEKSRQKKERKRKNKCQPTQ